jgi:hypothetical protein
VDPEHFNSIIFPQNPLEILIFLGGLNFLAVVGRVDLALIWRVDSLWLGTLLRWFTTTTPNRKMMNDEQRPIL